MALKPQSVADFFHKVSSFSGIVAAIAVAAAGVPVPDHFSAQSIVVYATGVLGALGLFKSVGEK